MHVRVETRERPKTGRTVRSPLEWTMENSDIWIKVEAGGGGRGEDLRDIQEKKMRKCKCVCFKVPVWHSDGRVQWVVVESGWRREIWAGVTWTPREQRNPWGGVGWGDDTDLRPTDYIQPPDSFDLVYSIKTLKTIGTNILKTGKVHIIIFVGVFDGFSPQTSWGPQLRYNCPCGQGQCSPACHSAVSSFLILDTYLDHTGRCLTLWPQI